MDPHRIMTNLRQLITDWDGFLLNPNYRRCNNEVNWISDDEIMFPPNLTIDHLLRYIKQHNYSYMIHDGSLLQFRYVFRNDKTSLEYACLSFMKFIDVAEDNLSNKVPVPWMRVDYCPELAKGITHTACHLHLSISEEVRIPLNMIPTPRQFVLAVIAWFYPDEFKIRIENTCSLKEAILRLDKFNKYSFASSNVDYNVMHLRISSN